MAIAIRNRTDVLVLCYHAVSANWSSPLAVTPERLRGHLRFLKSRGFKSVSFTAAVTGKVEGRCVAVTFDDGYRSVYSLAKPVLDEFGMIATVFVPTEYIGQSQPMSWPGIEIDANGAHAMELVPMTWPETRELNSVGWEIGSHSISHPDLTELDDIQLTDQLVESRQRCTKELGRPCTSIAFPYGAVDDRVVAATRAAGYEAGAALMYSEAVETSLSHRRIGLHQHDSGLSFRIKTSLLMRKLWRTPAWPVIGWTVAKVRERTSG